MFIHNSCDVVREGEGEITPRQMLLRMAVVLSREYRNRETMRLAYLFQRIYVPGTQLIVYTLKLLHILPVFGYSLPFLTQLPYFLYLVVVIFVMSLREDMIQCLVIIQFIQQGKHSTAGLSHIKGVN